MTDGSVAHRRFRHRHKKSYALIASAYSCSPRLGWATSSGASIDAPEREERLKAKTPQRTKYYFDALFFSACLLLTVALAAAFGKEDRNIRSFITLAVPLVVPVFVVVAAHVRVQQNQPSVGILSRIFGTGKGIFWLVAGV